MLSERLELPSFEEEYRTFNRPYFLIHFSKNFTQEAQGLEFIIWFCLLSLTTVRVQPRSCDTSPRLFTTARSACIVWFEYPHPRDREPTLFRELAIS
jgi:hypothetical protein